MDGTIPTGLIHIEGMSGFLKTAIDLDVILAFSSKIQ